MQMRRTVVSALGFLIGLGCAPLVVHSQGVERAPCAGRDSGLTARGIFFRCTGAGRDAVILIHAFSVDSRMWSAQLEALKGFGEVIVYDLRSHGRSAPATAPFLATDDLLGLMDELQIATAHLIGLSNGARIALDFALVHPRRVRSLVLAAPGVSGFTGGDFSYMAPVIEAARRGDVEQAAARWAETPLMYVADQSAAAVVRALTADNRAIWGYRTNPEVLPNPPAIQRLTSVRVPVLVLTGGEDLPDLRRLADSVARTIPRAKQVVVPSARHLVNLAAPDRFNRVVLAFLHSVR